MAPQWIEDRISSSSELWGIRNSRHSSKLLDAAKMEVGKWRNGMPGVPEIVRDLDFFEICCGKGGVTSVLNEQGYAAQGFDTEHWCARVLAWCNHETPGH